jgi:hypothetical protein
MEVCAFCAQSARRGAPRGVPEPGIPLAYTVLSQSLGLWEGSTAMDNGRNSEEFNWAVKGGAVAGIAGGVVIALLMGLFDAVQGRDLWIGTKMAAYPFLGERVLQPGFDGGAVLLGLASHFGVSIIWGVLFGLLAFGLTSAGTIWFGLLWGLVVWIGMYYVVLPAVGAGEIARSAPLLGAVVNHLIFGLAVAIGFLPYQRTHMDGRPWWQRRRYARAR